MYFRQTSTILKEICCVLRYIDTRGLLRAFKVRILQRSIEWH